MDNHESVISPSVINQNFTFSKQFHVVSKNSTLDQRYNGNNNPYNDPAMIIEN